MSFFVNLAISSLVISTAAWVAKKSPQLAGYIVSLPISTMLLLALTQGANQDGAAGVKLARSILVALPLSLLFFVPFVLPARLPIPFWVRYGSGVALLTTGYFLHRFVARLV